MPQAFDNQPHFAFENVNDLLLRMRVRRHPTPGGECGEHLIHCLAMCDGPARDSRTNFNRRIFCFHFQKLPRRVRRANLLGSGRRGDLVSPNRSRGAARRNELNFVHGLRGLTQISFASSWFPDSFRTCHPSLLAGTMRTMKMFSSLITILFAALIATPSF